MQSVAYQKKISLRYRLFKTCFVSFPQCHLLLFLGAIVKDVQSILLIMLMFCFVFFLHILLNWLNHTYTHAHERMQCLRLNVFNVSRPDFAVGSRTTWTVANKFPVIAYQLLFYIYVHFKIFVRNSMRFVFDYFRISTNVSLPFVSRDDRSVSPF